MPLKTRLSAVEIRYILAHSGAEVLVADTELLPALVDVVSQPR